MKLSEIIEQWTIDTKIDPLDLGNESIRAPLLHAKYYQFYIAENMQLKKLLRLQKELKKEKWEFYSGKGTAQQYKEANFNIRVMKGDIPVYMEGDKDLNDLQDKIDVAEQKVQVLKDIIAAINNRNWVIRNAIEWRRFTDGG